MLRRGLGSDTASTTVGREASHLIGALATVVMLVPFSICIDINNAFRKETVASNANYGGMFANYGFESHEPSSLS
jgi:hypothetical protein